MALRQQPMPSAGDNEVVIQVSFAGICGSELSGYLGHNALRKPPLVMGHEFVGVITALGSQVQESRPQLRLGQAVTVNPLSACGQCDSCRQGVEQLCSKRTLVGAGRPGAYADYVSVPADQVYLLPPGLSARSAALTEPVAVAVHIAALLGDVAGKTLLIAGAGPIGLLVLQMLRLHRVESVLISDLNAERRAMAQALGGSVLNPAQDDVVQAVREATNGAGAFAAIDAVGVSAARKQCVSALRSRGQLILSGLHEEVGPMPVAEMIRREIRAQGVFAYSHADFAAALDLLAAGRIHLDPWIVEAPLAAGGEWFERLVAGEGGVAKVLLQP